MFKQTFLISICVFLALMSFSQTKNRVSIFYSPASNGIDMKEGWTSDSGYIGKGANLFELRYSRNINSFLSIETGLQYVHNKIKTEYFPEGVLYSENSEINMVSIPIYGNLTFLKYFFVEAGPTLDFETNHSSSSSIGDHIGFAFGLGGKYTYKNITVIVNPFSQHHLPLSFGGEDFIKRLWQSGIKFGLGYNF